VPLERITEPKAIQSRCRTLKQSGQRIAFVPTMGFLHEGHLSLLREGRRRGDVLALSIFINPLQFGPREDLARYPRDEAGDLEKAQRCGVDLVFAPAVETMYPSGAQTTITVRELEQPLCGARRPGHFVGVATVVAKLFHLVQPDVALFGQKDYQQLCVIRQMVADLNFAIEVVNMPIVREPDGLAMSSRNAYLSQEERARARALSQGLRAAAEQVRAGEERADVICATARAPLAAAATSIDYVELRDATTLTPVEKIAPGQTVVLAVAAFIGKTRLIDNVLLPE
jgi:pantoate--beta-alanine ligase